MAYSNSFLIRTSLSDVGNKDIHGSYCSSPDMICHPQVQNPKEYFRGNYNSDVNQVIDTSSMVNMIYVRSKLLRAENTEKLGYIRIYRATTSLFMNSNLWKNNGLSTPKGRDYLTVKASANGEIAVAEDVFLVDGTEPNFCMIGIVNDSIEETVPNPFRTYNDFVLWVHNNSSVTVRNFRNAPSGNSNDLQSLYDYSNPEEDERFGLFTVEAKNFPQGTIYGVKDPSLNIDIRKTFDPNNPSTHKLSASASVLGKQKGYIQLNAKLPANTVWPEMAEISVKFYITPQENEEMAVFGVPAESVVSEAEILAAMPSNAVLVKVGECSRNYIKRRSL